MTKYLKERDVVTELLRQFKNSPCLWDTTHESYYNKKARKRQLKRLLVVYRQMDPNGTVESLKRKLDIYRSSYRRQKKRVENSIANGAGPDSVHIPTLWYYNLLTFLKSSDEVENRQCLTAGKKRRISLTEHDVESDETDESQDESCRSKMTTPDYLASYAESVAGQLRELEEPVRYDAERIILDVIYRARTGSHLGVPVRARQSRSDSPEVVDTLMIPQFGPSWYDVSGQDDNKEPIECLVVTSSDDDKETEST